MSYMTMEEQIASHLKFLAEHHFVVKELHIDQGVIRCNTIGETSGRGELCYQTKTTQLNRGLIGLATWIRGKGGQVKIHKTYGIICPNSYGQSSYVKDLLMPIDKSEAVEKATVFWKMSDQVGEAAYLLRKGVGYYGIRFRHTNYGKIAVIPMKDIAGKLWSYQLINADGSKKFAKNVEIKSLLHMLHTPIDGFPIGLTESYVTAATCFELTGMAMVTAFSANNLKPVGVALKNRFPNNRIIIFGDNDRHLHENKGKLAAYESREELGSICQVVIPEFEGYPASREFSDWNDFVRERGLKETREMIKKVLNMG